MTTAPAASPTPYEIAAAVAQKLRSQQPPTPQIPAPLPAKPCRGDSLSECSDTDLLEWGKPLLQEITRYYGYYSEDSKKAMKIEDVHQQVKAFEDLQNLLADRFRDCCAEDAAKYYRELALRVGGGNQQIDFEEWEHRLMQPVGSPEWKSARGEAAIKILNIESGLHMRMINMGYIIAVSKLKNPAR